LVLSVGHTWTQAGYAGEDTPKSIFPTSVGWVDLPAEADQGDDADNSEDTQMQDVSQEGGAGGASDNHIGKKDADGGDVAPQPVGAGVVPTKKRITKRGKYYVGDGEISCWRPDMEIKSPMKDGLSKLLARTLVIWFTVVITINCKFCNMTLLTLRFISLSIN
jgi:actin-related protein